MNYLEILTIIMVVLTVPGAIWAAVPFKRDMEGETIDPGKVGDREYPEAFRHRLAARRLRVYVVGEPEPAV